MWFFLMIGVFYQDSSLLVVGLLGVFYQDSSMKCGYEAFPEMLFVDATHKLNELRMPFTSC